MSRILSLDIGFKNTGHTVWEDGEIIKAGVIRTHAARKKIAQSTDYSLRAMVLSTELADICDDYDISAVVGEMPHGGAKSFRAGAMMCMANAIVSSVVAVLGIDHVWVSPLQVKRIVCEKDNASKDEIMEKISEKFGRMFVENGRKRYELCSNVYIPSVFEHIADSIGAYLVLQDHELITKNNGKIKV